MGSGIRKRYTGMFEQSLKYTPEFAEVLDIARRNSSGKIWIIGGFVYRHIIRELYGNLLYQSKLI